jgi:small subunit ribosomal protein S4
VRHGHVQVNGRRVDVPSYLVRVGDELQIKERPKSVQLAQSSQEQTGREVPDFLAREDGMPQKGQVVRLPEADDVSIPVQTHLIVELCSK